MAKPGTTHVIEIETGIGEPAFIPLTMGSELQPISVGKKGMWRIESARVLDVHAFVYFDGTSLFLQSADESQAASVDGYRVGKAWTELHPPCKIEIGAARLRFRSLSDAPSEAKPMAVPPSRPAAGAPMPAPVHAHPPSGSTRVGDSRPIDVAPQMPPTQQRSARGTGQLGQLLSSGAAPVQAIPASQRPPGMMNNAIMSGVHNLAPTMPPHQGFSQMPQMQPMMGQPMGALSSGSMNVGGMGSGSYGSMNGSRAAPTIQTGERHAVQQGGGFNDQIAKYKELSPPKRLLVLMSPFCLIAAAYLLLFDDDGEQAADPNPGPTVQEAGVAANGQPIPGQPIPGQPIPIPIPGQAVLPGPDGRCQAGFVLYPAPVGGKTVCVPMTQPAPGPLPAPAPLPGPQPGPGPKPGPGPAQQAVPVPEPAPSFPTSNVKTLERQAVDAVAVNDYARAAAIYDQLLAQSNPKNPVYAEAARILRQKAAMGAGPAQ